jgi:hypothetical protein
MPNEMFYPSSAPACVMVWHAHVPHDSNRETFFGYYKEDGLIKHKTLGRIDLNNQWKNIQNKWLKLYRNLNIEEGMSARACVNYKDEWLCEAYMKADYTKLTQADFQKTLNEYFAYLVKSGGVYED